ncbi:2-oxoacid dehydrogenases acyltransferase-domain-containing protein [Gloeopeniophorella convolvens]|nr:2-oxoacid dehydrogenases acyltransferase-domain-containing protein [Gloeopeniophorella convolvens]
MLLLRPTRRVLSRQPHVAFFHASPAWWAARKVLQRFKLADIGEGITECEVIKWNVAPHSPIAAFEPLCEVQSDKASVEITSPYDGTVTELLVQEGEVAQVGAGLCIIEVDEEAAADAPEPHHEQERAPVPAPTPTPTPVPARRPHPLDPSAAPAPKAGALSAPSRTETGVLALPAVRHFARQSGVDIALLAPGSGKNGRVERADVERYLAGGKGASVAEQEQRRADVPSKEDVVVELGRTRYGMWKAMEKSLEIPHFGYTTHLDLTALHNMLPLLNAHIPAHYLPPSPTPASPAAVSPSALYPAPAPPAPPASGTYTKLTFLPLLLKALAKAMHAWPLFRASITPGSASAGAGAGGKPTLSVRPHADISIALSTPTGLYTPTLRRVDAHSAYSLASALRHVAHLGRQVPCALTPAELPRRGGTLTVSNVGAIGDGASAMPVLVPGGGVAIVALGRARWEWDVQRGDGRGERRLRMGVSWAADHRVVEGAELAAFVEEWRGWVERPERMVAEGV